MSGGRQGRRAGHLRRPGDWLGGQRPSADAGGQSTAMPNYVMLVSTIGSMSPFGLNGFILGLVIAAMTREKA
ncbi:MAG: hypothetical protein H7238_07985 [Polaromonas sp.]|nr:hypothetical protein [Polaromonas sp.]